MFQMFVGFAAMEANWTASGLGYRAKTDKEPENYNALRMVRIQAFEMMQNPIEAIGHWNIGSQ